ncbi:MAG: CBS domain-containing protein [Betaproteobacteria bacterium]|nr:CBS domain-containing protein [Betaproteobacteria bacterium]
MTQPAPTLIASTVADLRRHAPFDAMDRALLGEVAAKLKLRYYEAGSVILDPSHGQVVQLFIVQRGLVEGFRPGAEGGGAAVALTLSEGECFPVGAILGRRPTHLCFRAAEDTFCHEMDGAVFEDLMDRSREFRHYATARLSNLVEQSRRGMQSDYAGRMAGLTAMAQPLKSLLGRETVTAGADVPIREVLSRMHTLRIGSVVIVDEAKRPIGIFTERDVLDRVALAGTDLAQPISLVMTRDPQCLPATAALFEAAQLMARKRFRHVLVVEDGMLAGVVSERDLFALQRLSPGEIGKAIHTADSVAALAHAAAEVRKLAGGMLAQGVAAEQLTQFVSTLNDAVVERALSLGVQAEDGVKVRWCWLGLGSEGRMEQTLATDQDNAIIFAADPDSAEASRADLLKLAARVNATLDQCGFPLCTGDIMAKNPRWCLTEAEWRALFADWMRSSSPDALLNAAIFFDFRPLAGDFTLADGLRTWLNEHARHQTGFLRQMAVNALQARPPLGVIRDFVPDDSDHPGSIDLKRYGARPFIDAARIFALAHGVSATNTAERLRIAGPRMRLGEEEVASAIDGFHFVQMLRLKSSDPEEAETGGLPPNRVDPERLSALDRRILKEALRQARKLQSRLELDYQV